MDRAKDGPPIDYPPDRTSSQAATLKRAGARGGLAAVWERLDRGEPPERTPGSSAALAAQTERAFRHLR